jgi:hypothetical protein
MRCCAQSSTRWSSRKHRRWCCRTVCFGPHVHPVPTVIVCAHPLADTPVHRGMHCLSRHSFIHLVKLMPVALRPAALHFVDLLLCCALLSVGTLSTSAPFIRVLARMPSSSQVLLSTPQCHLSHRLQDACCPSLVERVCLPHVARCMLRVPCARTHAIQQPSTVEYPRAPSVPSCASSERCLLRIAGWTCLPHAARCMVCAPENARRREA